ncbi:MAG: PAS domain-containing protein [Candidatus Contendobacter sp.]|nr:PAS domain-containing protein [Candidatus Contendobacter sp.]
MTDTDSKQPGHILAIPETARLREDLEALRRVVAKEDQTFLSLIQRVDQILDTARADRMQLDQAMKRERDLSRFVGQVLGSIQDVLVVTDPNGIIVQANTAAYRELGCASDALLGIAVDLLLPPEVRAAHERQLSAQRAPSASAWVAAIAERGRYLEEHHLLRPNGGGCDSK